MLENKPSFRKEVIRRQNLTSSLTWDLEATIKICLEVNQFFISKNQNPAPKFREKIAEGDDKYIKNWVLGCRFEWLNPR